MIVALTNCAAVTRWHLGSSIVVASVITVLAGRAYLRTKQMHFGVVGMSVMLTLLWAVAFAFIFVRTWSRVCP